MEIEFYLLADIIGNAQKRLKKDYVRQNYCK